ncbi:hypothetical protein [Sphingomonas sp. Ant20]|uniref:hypothetical protein n=1 Tax=Sphingomonas sp. Ant20 TaxID=104605 RepID=UPI000A4BE102|nr:hypothetical protein [Sphingomonas sp. Ant20]
MRASACLIALLLVTTSAVVSGASAQTPGTPYHRAPDAIARALETPPTPGVSVSPDHRTLAILGRENLPSIANLSKPILRLGGYRIDPATNGQAEVRVQWLNALQFKDLASGKTINVALRPDYALPHPTGRPTAPASPSTHSSPTVSRCGSPSVTAARAWWPAA